MPAFEYKVRDRSGRTLNGQLEADSVPLVASRLRSMGYTPVKIDKLAGQGVNRELHLPGRAGRVKQKDVAVFARQFATMIDSGLTMLRALRVLVEQTQSRVLSEVLDEVRGDIEHGSALSHALARHPKAFSRLFVAMVRAGETGGVLDSVLLQLAATIEKQVELRRKIKSAMTYPAVVLSLSLSIVAAMLIFIVPTFKSIFAELGGKLPLPTQLLMSISHIAARFFPFILLAAVAAVLGLRRWVATPPGRAAWDSAKLRIPLLGRLVLKTALARFARTLAALLRSGVPILEAVEITKDTVGNVSFSGPLSDLQSGVKAGEPIARRLAAHRLFPPMVTQMLAVGEETGSVDTLLDKVAEFYEQEIEAMVASLTSLLEPVMIVVLGGIVGSMVISLYLPMFNIIKLIK